MTLRIPDAQTLFIVSVFTSHGNPASRAAWRDGICPWPPCNTFPIITSSTSTALSPARLIASFIAIT